MNNFQLSDRVDKEKVFMVNLSEVEGRLDSEFYKPNNTELVNKIRGKPHYKLKEIVSFSKETWNQKDYFENSFPYIEISEIDLSNGKVNYIKSIPIHEAPSRAKMVIRKNDIIVSTTRPTRGAISFFDKLEDIAIASTGFSVIRDVNDSKISRKALFYLLKLPFSLKQMGQRSSGGNYPAITQEELGKIIIPKLSEDIQKKIINTYETTYTQKQQKEAEAKKLLASIDDYLLNELGITLPEKDNSLKSRIFTTSLSKVIGGRLDPEYNQSKYAVFDKTLSNIAYMDKVGNTLTSIVSGATPKAKGDSYEINGEYYFVRLTDFNNSLEVDLSKSLFIKREIHVKDLKRSILKKGDVLFGIAGSIGKIAIYNHHTNANINQAIARLRFKDGVNANYMAYLLNSVILKYQINRNKRPMAQPNLNTNELKNLKIPIPPLEKQTKIADHVSSIRAQAKQLEQEAKEILEKAKEEVEQMILGG